MWADLQVVCGDLLACDQACDPRYRGDDGVV
jgi:hypothetical protein